MALPAPIQGYGRPADRLHYFHPFRTGISIALILAGGSALVAWGWFSARDGETVLNSAIVTAILVFLVGRIFLPRALTVDGTTIRWTIRFRPPARTAPRADVRAIHFLTTSGPGRQRYYFVNRDGKALLWVDRFTPAEMLALANYLALPMRSVQTVPEVAEETRAADARWRAIASKRAQVASFAVVALIGLAMTIFLSVVAVQSVVAWSAYQRAGICHQPPAAPLSCRLETTAIVTGIGGKQDPQQDEIFLRFAEPVLAYDDHRSTFVWLPPGVHLEPPAVVGQTLPVELFDAQYIMGIDGIRLAQDSALKSMANWWYVPVVAVIPVLMGLFAYGSWKGDVSGYMGNDERKPAKKVTPWPGWLKPIGAAGTRLWIAWVR